MSGLLTVIPVLDEKITDVCIDSILMPGSAAGLSPDEILLVDNSRDGFAGKYGLRVHRDPEGYNIGVSRSWNIGAKEVVEKDLDYLVIMSASMMFGPELHTTWKKQMETFWGENVIECDGHSFHLIAFHRRVFEAVGYFDTNFWPGYFEAEDFSFRMRQVGMEGGWTRVWVNVLSTGVARHVKELGLLCPADPLLRYRALKWGGPKGLEKFDRPFDNEPLDYFPEQSIPELAKEYGLGERGTGWW